MSPHGVHSTSPAIHRINATARGRLETFLSVPRSERRTVWPRLSRATRRDIVTKLPDTELVELVEAIDPDQATDALQELPPKRQRDVLRIVQKSIREQVETLLQFDPDTAAGMMSLDYIQVDDTETFAHVGKRFKEHEKRTGRPAAILVLCSGVLYGMLPTHQLAVRKATETIRAYLRPIATIRHGARRREIVQTFRDNPHDKVAVVNEHGSVLGIVYSDDVLRMLQEHPESSLFSFAGVKETETITDATLTKVKRRYTWLVINLGTAFLAAFTVSLFEATIAQFVLLAVYMPIVAGMGGNAATQTLAVLVRGIAQRHIDARTALRVLKNEIAAGALNGMLNGLIVAAIVIALHGDLRLALVLGLAMIINLVVAGFFGTIVPLIMQRLGKDPATSATIFITTATDVLGFMAFLGLATLIL